MALAGCMEGMGDNIPSLPSMGAASQPSTQALTPVQANGDSSAIIESLIDRRSLLPSGPYAQVSNAVLAANSRAAEADLRAARLRSEARNSNWLPTIGPNVSLTSLGDVVTSLVVDAVLFDNGGKKAERDYAAADVEVAAVALAQDTNERVLQGLELYLAAEKSRAQAQVNADAMAQMERYAYIMSERVKGGISSRVDLNIVQQKLNQMQAQMASDKEATNTALAELSAMSASSVDGITGISTIGAEHTAKPLAVLKAEAEASRAMAEARAARAGLLPSLTASASRSGGETNTGLNLGGAGIGFGTGASLKALEETQAAANARVGQVREDTNRTLRALEAELASLQRQEAQAQTLAAQAASNYQVYAAQQREGTRSVPETVGLFETKVRAEREAAALKFDVARVALQIAAQKGVLVDGDKI